MSLHVGGCIVTEFFLVFVRSTTFQILRLTERNFIGFFGLPSWFYAGGKMLIYEVTDSPCERQSNLWKSKNTSIIFF